MTFSAITGYTLKRLDGKAVLIIHTKKGSYVTRRENSPTPAAAGMVRREPLSYGRRDYASAFRAPVEVPARFI